MWKRGLISSGDANLVVEEVVTMIESGIKLNDLLGFQPHELPRLKFRFNKWNGVSDPLDEYLQDPERVNTNWFLNKTKNDLFRKGEIGVCLLEIMRDTWLMTTVKDIVSVLNTHGVNYEATEIERLKPFFGRVVVKFHKASSPIYRWKTVGEQLEVIKVLETTFERDTFKGYDNVCLSYGQLKTIIEKRKQDWYAALESQQAVYLITDTHTGKLYVGSATSKTQMLLARWTSYVKNGHGGNVVLRELVEREKFDYVKKYFQYTILENYNGRVNPDIVLSRESWWKNVLKSREHGYNKN